jgi:shikimate dehydrogenase
MAERPGPVPWPTAATKVAGIIGDPVAHSLTPLLHNTAFAALGLDWISVGFTVAAGQAGAAIAGMRALGLVGLSVTMPHKSEVAGLVDERTEVAEQLGAVNSVYWSGARLVGDNTDGEGFLAALTRGTGFDPSGRRCMVLGSGGAARAVVLALARAGAAEVVVVNRTPGRAEPTAQLAGARGRVGRPAEGSGMDLVVNATPAGMQDSPAASTRPLVAAGAFGPGQVAVDLIYHPARTAWLDEAAAQGATVLGGLGMLVHQAAVSLARWTGLEPPVDAMWSAASGALPDDR